jgi:thymidylate synthase (FAD)
MLVSLLQHTPDPEQTVALAARLCYSPATIDTLRERLVAGDVSSFLEKIMSLGHHSVLEHVTFTFGVEGISRACSHQLVRHRVASYSQQSQRYVTFAGDDFPQVVPDSIATKVERQAVFAQAMQACAAAYRTLVADGVPPEDARFVLPNAAETKIIVTMNARELRHFFALRCCERAQWEIRALALAMLKLVKPLAPILFRDAGPGCLVGPCPEGTMTCGKPVGMRKLFKEIL